MQAQAQTIGSQARHGRFHDSSEHLTDRNTQKQRRMKKEKNKKSARPGEMRDAGCGMVCVGGTKLGGLEKDEAWSRVELVIDG